MRSHSITTHADPDRPNGGPLRRFLGAPFRTDTYARLLYLLAAFPLGIAYFVVVAVGFSFGIGASITLLGLPVLVLTVAGVAVFGAVEARLAAGLLGIDASLPETLRADNPDGIRRIENGAVDTLVDLFTAPTTWTSLVLVLLKLAYGIAAVTLVVGLASLTGSMLAAPFVYDRPDVTYTIGTYAVETLPEALALAAVGVPVGFASVHLLNGLATAGGYMTAALLNLDRRSEAGAGG
jgi:hypothetical protein